MQQIVAGLGADLPAAVLIVSHVSRSDRLELPAAIRGKTPLPVRFALERERLQHGIVLVAPPDRHLIVKPNEVWLSRGPRESGWPPAVDVLFRSAAITYGPRVIGVVLSGALDDGTAGLAAIRACGGIAMVQDPAEAQFRDMPESVLRNVEVTRCAPVAEPSSSSGSSWRNRQDRSR